MDFQSFVFFFLSAILIYASLRVITARNPVHAVTDALIQFADHGAERHGDRQRRIYGQD